MRSAARRSAAWLGRLAACGGLLAAVPWLVAADPPDRQSLAVALRVQVEQARRIAPALGAHVVELASGEEVFAHAADRRRILASNTKLLTSTAALLRLGPGYLFETPLLLSGEARGGVLEGQLAVVGSGDPAISGRFFQGDPYAVFRGWAAALQRLGVRRVEGGVLLVDGRFEGETVHPDWPRDQLDRWYEAPVSALSFNDNCLLVRAWPSIRPGGAGVVEVLPRIRDLSLVNATRTVASARSHRVAISRAQGSDDVVVRGNLYRLANLVESAVTVPDPALYFGRALVDAFAEEGVEVRGELQRRSSLPNGHWAEVARHRTDLLSVLEVVGKRSQNLFAESVLKALGAEVCGRGSWAAAVPEVLAALAELGVDTEGLALTDGSGLSRNNLATPRQMTDLLARMFRHPRGPDLLLTLPFSGEADTGWEDRLAEAPYRGNVIAKTGTLSGVSTLSGYAKGTSGRIYAFSLLLNQTRGAWHGRRAQDGFLRALVDRG